MHQNESIFVDWITVSQCHTEGVGGVRLPLPILLRGIVAHYDSGGNCRFERTSPTHLRGSWDTTLLLGCDGARVFLSGNVGRFARQDNLFNLGWRETIAKANRILQINGLPAFGPAVFFPDGEIQSAGARLHRLDLTGNFCTGSEGQAAAVIEWLASQSVQRAKRGHVVNESVWWSNTRRMLKAYVKAREMRAHGADTKGQSYQWAQENGVVRVEVELKRRLLQEAGLDQIGNVTDEKLVAMFKEHTDILRRVDRSDEPDILAAIPAGSRVYAAAWLAGHDLRQTVSRATLFRHAKVCRQYGMDIISPRNVARFPVRVRVIDLQPATVPEWYSLVSDLEKCA